MVIEPKGQGKAAKAKALKEVEAAQAELQQAQKKAQVASEKLKQIV